MLDDVSPAVERALDAARRRAGEGGLDAVHIFLALIEDDESRAAQAVVAAGGRLAAVRQVLEAHAAVPFDLTTVLGGAREVAGQRAETTVTGEFLLLGLVQTSAPIRDSLARAGVLVEKLTQPADIPTVALDEPLDLRDPTDDVAAARVVDANANRAREALRVLDDYCRFVLDDAVLTEEMKIVRHRFADLLACMPAATLYEARDTLADVGTAISTTGEMARESPAEVARINFKRLQEALRSLEEFGKVIAPDFAGGLEAIRYRTYTLERAVGIGADARTRLETAKLYVLLTGSQCSAALDWTIREAADGGADVFQLREKSLSDRDLLERARNVRRWTRETQTLFIVNDRPDIARLAEADGVHLGQDDMSVKDARRILGAGPLIGVSTHNADQVRKAILDGASYIGVGPTFASTTKDFGELAGLDFVREAAALTTLPAFVIGGMNASNIGQAVAAGAKRVAVTAAVCQADEPAAAARAIRSALDH
ncbi:MAG TPA: thiamine phosphate synthase [Gemmataceae bacterium]|nr:thiamine phosphate synthase [Gemmataceae bacterium]